MSVLDPRRDTDVTASDIPAICGECPFQNRHSVLFKKALRLKSQDNPATLHGRTHEPTALDKFCKATNAKVIEYPCQYKRDVTYMWLGGTKDAKVRMPNGDVVVVEIKCPISRPIKDEVPAHYVGQVQTYLYIEKDALYALFVQYKPAGVHSSEKLQITKVERDSLYMDIRLPSLKRFWDELQLWTAYVDRIVTVLQRAWRCYRSKKAADAAAKQCMVTRLKCAKTVGKIAGFCRTRDAQRGMNVPPDIPHGEYIVQDGGIDNIAPRYYHRPASKRRRFSNDSIFIVD
jgi:putative phage-type endonuclease